MTKQKKPIDRVIEALEKNQNELDSDSKLSMEDIKMVLADINYAMLTIIRKFRDIGMNDFEDNCPNSMFS